MNTKHKKGFTLVELVVVIAIIGVLAAILIPTMINYVKKARMRTANSNAKLIYSTAKTVATDYIADGKSGHDIEVMGIPSDLPSMAADDYETCLYEQIAAVMRQNGASEGKIALTVDDRTYIGYAQWTSDVNARVGSIVGQYPDPPLNIDQAQSITLGNKFTPES